MEDDAVRFCTSPQKCLRKKMERHQGAEPGGERLSAALAGATAAAEVVAVAMAFEDPVFAGFAAVFKPDEERHPTMRNPAGPRARSICDNHSARVMTPVFRIRIL